MKRVLGLDIGGANIKAAHSNGEAWSEPFALWRAPQELGPRLAAMIAANLAREFDEVRLTMTAELCDCFATKSEGVNSVIDAVVTLAGERPVWTWSTTGRFVTPAEAKSDPLSVAASNWHALGTAVAREFSRETGLALLIDIGSTTTDIVLLRDGRVEARGFNDMDRLASGELVYTGAWRTALMACGPTVRVRGREVRVMAEYFASMADVHLLLDHIAEEPACNDTADGRSATKANAAARIVRMVGADMEMLTIADALDIASQFSTRQLDAIGNAIGQVVGDKEIAQYVVSGQGAFLARAAIRSSNVINLSETIGREASIAACAWAILRL